MDSLVSSVLSEGLTIVIPTIPVRIEAGFTRRAVDSAERALHYMRDSRAPVGPLREFGVITPCDTERVGAALNRQEGLDAVKTTWVMFLDDDDEFLEHHVDSMLREHAEHAADFYWSRFEIRYPGGAKLDGPAFLGKKAFSQWDDADPCQTTVTTMVRTELAREAGGFAWDGRTGEEIDGNRRGEDYAFTVACRKAGGKFRHREEVTWLWHHHGRNTSGMIDKW